MASTPTGSPESESHTIPNTPVVERFSRPETNSLDGDFARLVPSNRQARIAFSEVAEKVKSDPGENSHVMRYMYIYPEKSDMAEEMSASETDNEFPAVPQLRVWTGYYRFNLDILPATYKLGWVVGRGRFGLEHGGVDFKLTCNSGTHVAGRHARFSHNAAGILLVRSDSRRVVLDGKEEIRNDQRALVSPVTGLGIGDLFYTLNFTNLKTYKDQLKKIRREHDELYEPLPFLDPTPSGTDYVLQKYSIKGVFAYGSTCTVSSGFNRLTGSTVAIKKIKSHGRDTQNILQEVNLLRAVSPHPSICELVEILRIGSQDSLQSVEEIYLIYSPLAERRLFDVVFSDMDVFDRITIFRQITDAVAHIHSKGIMHRDIKTQNVVVVTSSPPISKLIDFGAAIRGLESRDHMVGTIRYLAPEVINLKVKKGVGSSYNRAVDIWSLGISAYELFCKKRICWVSITARDFSQIKREIIWEGAVLGGTVKVLDQMLQWVPSDRIPAGEALKQLDMNSIEDTQQGHGLEAGMKHPRAA